jgi:GntR family transcriptional regulator
LIIKVDPSGPVPAYEQIRTQVATMITTGVLEVGGRLPSVRQLASDLGLAVNTVARAYRELEADGLVVSRVRHGTTVAERRQLSRSEIRDRLADAAREYALAARQLGVTVDEAQDAVRAQLHEWSASR